MKKDYFDYMDTLMEQNDSIYFLMAGLGFPRTQEFIDKYPNRAFNTGAREQTTLDIAVGLAYAGKIPFVYTITPFYYRAFETIRTYVAHERLNVNMIGAGRDEDYSQHDGFSHYAGDDVVILGNLPNIVCCWPSDVEQMHDYMNEAVKSKEPYYINIPR